MNKQKLHLLILEDNPDDAELIVNELRKNDFDFEWERVETKKEFVEALAKKPDIILADYKLPTFDGMSAIKIKQKTAAEIPLIIVSGSIGEELAVDCMKAGATDYVLKDKLSRLSLVVERSLNEAVEHRELNKANETLKESEEKYKNLVESSLQGMVVALNNPVRLAYASPPMETITGYSTKELESFGSEELTELIYPEDRTLFFKTFTDRVSGKDVDQRGTYRINHKDGSVRWIELFSTLINYNNKPATQTAFIDITESKLAENVLRENHSRHAAMIANISDVIVIMDADGKTKYQSPNIERWFGWKAEDIIGKNGLEMVHPEDIEMIQKELKNVLENESASTLEFRFKCKDGKYKWIELTALNRFNEPSINGLLLNYHDIAERKQESII